MLGPTRLPCRVDAIAQPSRVLEVLRQHREAYEARYGGDPVRLEVLWRICSCRTEALGTHPCVCEDCGWQGLVPNPCHDRHCPQCGGLATHLWLEAQKARMLPVPHFQVTFTLPAALRPVAMANPAVVYGLLFSSASSVLHDLADQKLHARLGITAALHTWSQVLIYHPHLHCIVTAGGLDRDAGIWMPSRSQYLFSHKVLGEMFRGRFLEGLIDASESDGFRFPGVDPRTARAEFRSTLRVLSKRHVRWIVDVEPPRDRPVSDVAAYLARYARGIAISDARVLEVTDHDVTIRTRKGPVRIEGVEFVRRYLLHTLPSGFRRIRHYGLYAPGAAKTSRETARALLAPATSEVVTTDDGVTIDGTDASPQVAESDPSPCPSRAASCPNCGSRRIRHLFVFRRPSRTSSRAREPP